ncbi:NB-ARC domain-containing protein [Kitasatospora sp. NPDC056184]|uniref:NB-ARC domain-containing protein n=1 Tax=Kitasatospora sp. NPDC056184 TaxID=3345738 RepID=UPI0035E21C3F
MAEETWNRVDGQVRAGAIVQAGSVGELHVHEAALRAAAVPYQLPPALSHFEDRADERARVLAAVAEGTGDGGGPLVVALSGMGGIGKTALGFELARALLDHCPDGALHVDLDDLRRDGAVETADALGDLLRALDPQTRPEQELRGRARQYWTATQGRRLVLVVDNARSGAELRPLLPSSGASIVIVASHGPLHDLDGVRLVDLPLGPLAPEDAVNLLRRIVADPRFAADPDAAAELARRCAGLPAALYVAGRWVRRHRRRELRRLVEDLATELDREGLPVVEAVWDAAYASLGPVAARLYRLLPHHPAPVVGDHAAAALLGTDPDEAADALDELDTAGLLERRPDGLGMHALLRGHALRRARAVDARDSVDVDLDAVSARQRLVRWYRRQAGRADLVAAGPRLTVSAPAAGAPAPAEVPDLPFPDTATALRWLEDERLALYGCVRIAAEDGLDEEAVALCEALWTHFLDHRHYADVIDAFGRGVAAAVRSERLAATVRMRCQLARPLWEQRRYEEAAEELRLAVHGARLLGDSPEERKLRASAVEFRGKLASVRGDWAAAVPDFEAAREEHRAIGNAYGVMLQTYLLGRAAVATGELPRAVELLGEAHASAAALGRDRMTARTGFELGSALRAAGRHAEAARLYEAALAAARERRSAGDELRVLEALVALGEETGDAESAEAYRSAAETLRGPEGSGGAPIA